MIIEIDLYIFYGEFYISRKKHINFIQIFFRDDLTENVRKYVLVGIMSKIVLKNKFLFILSDINFYDRLLSLLKRFKAIRTNSFG